MKYEKHCRLLKSTYQNMHLSGYLVFAVTMIICYTLGHRVRGAVLFYQRLFEGKEEA